VNYLLIDLTEHKRSNVCFETAYVVRAERGGGVVFVAVAGVERSLK
jgi:hypothetical protein